MYYRWSVSEKLEKGIVVEQGWWGHTLGDRQVFTVSFSVSVCKPLALH